MKSYRRLQQGCSPGTPGFPREWLASAFPFLELQEAIHGGGLPTSAPCFPADNYLDRKFLLFCKVSTQPQSSGFSIESHFLDGEAGALKGLSCSFGVPDTVSSSYGHELRMEVGLCLLYLTSGETLSQLWASPAWEDHFLFEAGS